MPVVPGFFTWLRLTQEAAFGVFDATQSNHVWIRLYQDTAFDPKLTPIRSTIRSADGYNRRRQNVTSRHSVTATLKTPLYPSQAGFLLGAATTLTATDLASYTFDYFNGIAIRRYLGGKFNSMNLGSSIESQYGTLDCALTFQSVDDTTLSTFPQPADSVFPAETPFLHTEATGRFTIGATPAVVPMFDTIGLSLSNILSGKFYDQQVISFLRWCGRDVDLSTHMAFLDTSWRTLYEAQTPSVFALEYYRSATQNLTLNFESVNFVADRSVTTPLGDINEQGLSIECFYDQTATTDFSFTAAYS